MMFFFIILLKKYNFSVIGNFKKKIEIKVSEKSF